MKKGKWNSCTFCLNGVFQCFLFFVMNSSVIYLFLLKLQGVVDVLCEACEQLQWKNPTKIQKEALPVALEGERLFQDKIILSNPTQ